MKELWYRVQGGPLVVLAATVLVIIAVGLFVEPPVTQAGPPLQEDMPAMPDDSDHTGERCADCHLDYKAVWETGVHAIAYERESFQEAWQAEGSPTECLQCHTTLYQPHDGQYLQEGVQCEACHGLNVADHPPADFVINRTTNACGDCHEGTFDEWRSSPHAFTDDMGTVACSTCHNPHGQTLRFEETNALCLNCHESAPNTYEHLTHNEVAFEGVEVTCASCHMPKVENDRHHYIPDHTMVVSVESCTNCHEALSAQGNVPLLVPVDEALATERDDLRHEVMVLEESLEECQEEQIAQNCGAVRLTQGLIAGLGVGITITWVLARNRRRNNANGRKA